MKRPTLLATIPIVILFASVATARGAASYTGSISVATDLGGQGRSQQNVPNPIADSFIGEDPSDASYPLLSGAYSVNPGNIAVSDTSSANAGGVYTDTSAEANGVWSDTITLTGAPISPNTLIYIDPVVEIAGPFGLPSLPQHEPSLGNCGVVADVTGGNFFRFLYGENNGQNNSSSVTQGASNGTLAGSPISVTLEASVETDSRNSTQQLVTISGSLTVTLLGFTVHDANGNLLPGITFTDSAGTLFPSIIPGDANADGVVDIQDLTTVANHWQQSVNDWSQGDFNGDGIVDIQDLTTVANHWQDGVSSGGGSSESFTDALAQIGGLTTPTPEPASLTLLALAILPQMSRRRR